MARFILIHGMFHGGWCWSEVTPRLEALGHTVVAPNLAGCSDDPTPASEVTLERWSADIKHLLEADPGKSILVGHSRGGIVASQTAEAAPNKVAAIVYLTALMLPNDASAMDLPAIMTAVGIEGSALTPSFSMSPDGVAMLAPANGREALYAGCSDETFDYAKDRIKQEPIRPLLTKLSLTKENWGRIPRVYVETRQDTVLPYAAQHAMVLRSPPTEVVTLDEGHMLIFSAVDAVVEVLDKAAANYA